MFSTNLSVHSSYSFIYIRVYREPVPWPARVCLLQTRSQGPRWRSCPFPALQSPGHIYSVWVKAMQFIRTRPIYSSLTTEKGETAWFLENINCSWPRGTFIPTIVIYFFSWLMTFFSECLTIHSLTFNDELLQVDLGWTNAKIESHIYEEKRTMGSKSTSLYLWSIL